MNLGSGMESLFRNMEAYTILASIETTFLRMIESLGGSNFLELFGKAHLRRTL
jgi:hypothetical protein